MFAYCGNDPAGKGDTTGHSWVHDLWRKAEAACWFVVGLALEQSGFTLTADLLNRAADGTDLTFSAEDGSYASELCRRDTGLQREVQDKIDSLNPDVDGRISHTWPYTIPLSDGDLGAALHNVYLSVEGVVQGNTVYATVTITDTFDFTEFKNPLTQGSVFEGLLWFANDIAYYDNKWGLLDPISVTIVFSEVYHYVIPIV